MYSIQNPHSIAHVKIKSLNRKAASCLALWTGYCIISPPVASFCFNFNTVFTTQSHRSSGSLFHHDLIIVSLLWSRVLFLLLSHSFFLYSCNDEILCRHGSWQNTHVNDYYPLKTPGLPPWRGLQINDKLLVVWLFWHHGLCPGHQYTDCHVDVKGLGSHHRWAEVNSEIHSWCGFYP